MSAIEQLHENPAFSSVSPEKMTFLEQVFTELEKQNKDTMIPFFLAVTTRANQLGISFTDQEAQLFMTELEKQMPDEGKSRLKVLRSVMESQKMHPLP
jgi:hypothetical protein